MKWHTTFFLKHKEHLLALGIYLLLWCALSVSTGYISSGFHFMEDHDIIDMMTQIKQAGFLNTVYTETVNDLGGRFRPLYVVYRYGCTALFALNFSCWHLVLGAFLMGLMWFAFKVGRLLGLSFPIALLFPLIIVTGSVIEAVSRLGTSELFGAFFAMAALYGILKSSKAGRPLFFTEMATHVSVFLACCSKEAFIFLIPVFMAVRVMADCTFRHQPINKAIRRAFFFMACQAIVLCFCVYMIEFHITQKKESLYAGFDGDISKALHLLLGTVLSAFNFKNLISGTGIYSLYILILVMCGSLLLLAKRKHVLFVAAVFIYIALTQYLIHYKIELSGHYLLPFMFAPALVICLLAELICVRYGRLGKILCSSFIILLVSIKAAQSYAQLNDYSNEGKANQALIKIMTEVPGKTPSLLISGDELMHQEHFEALLNYFNYFSKEGIESAIQLLPADDQKFMKIAEVKDSLLLPLFKAHIYKHFNKQLYADSIPLTHYDVILILSYCEERFAVRNKPNSLHVGYTKLKTGKEWYAYTVYKRDR